MTGPDHGVAVNAVLIRAALQRIESKLLALAALLAEPGAP